MQRAEPSGPRSVSSTLPRSASRRAQDGRSSRPPAGPGHGLGRRGGLVGKNAKPAAAGARRGSAAGARDAADPAGAQGEAAREVDGERAAAGARPAVVVPEQPAPGGHAVRGVGDGAGQRALGHAAGTTQAHRGVMAGVVEQSGVERARRRHPAARAGVHRRGPGAAAAAEVGQGQNEVPVRPVEHHPPEIDGQGRARGRDVAVRELEAPARELVGPGDEA